MIIREVTGVDGTVPEKTFKRVYQGEHGGGTTEHSLTSRTASGSNTLKRTIKETEWTRRDENGVTAQTSEALTYVTASGHGSTQVTGLEQTQYKTDYSASRHTYTSREFVSYSTSSRPLSAWEDDLSFNTTTTSIHSAKIVSVGTYTFLSQTTGSTTTSRFTLVNGRQVTTGSTTAAHGSAVYQTVTKGGASLQTYASTRWEVFDNSDNNKVFRVVAGQGGLPSYEELQAGFVLGESGWSVEAKEVEVDGETSDAPTSQGNRSWTEFVTYETTYTETEEFWEPYQTTREGWTDTTIATTTELFGTETDTTVDTETTYVETYEDYSSTTRIADYEISDTLTETSQVTVYQFTKTANRVSIGTKPTISTYGETVTTYKTTTSSETFSDAVGNLTLGTITDPYVVTSNFTTTMPKTDGALVGSVYATTKQTANDILSTTTYINEIYTLAEQVYAGPSVTYQGNYIFSIETLSGITPYFMHPIINGAGIDNFLLEPVGPPCIGGVHRSGNKLELVDNCPHTFPAMLLWQGVHDTIHAAAFASSFYEGGVPLISHNIPWEHESRTYNWLTADGSKGELKVQWTVDSTSTSSTTFSIGVEGECDYTGGKQTSQAGGEYFSSRKATLVANCPAGVSIKGGTTSFPIGTHEITEPMRFDIRRAGSVMVSGIVEIAPTYYAYNNVFITT